LDYSCPTQAEPCLIARLHRASYQPQEALGTQQANRDADITLGEVDEESEKSKEGEPGKEKEESGPRSNL
jgi:hypothetical protein